MFQRKPLWLFCLLVLLPQLASAELITVESESDDGTLITYQMSVSPAAEPVPALKHRLVTRELDLKSGNAAPYYYRALMGVDPTHKALHKKYDEQWYDWVSETPLDELPMEKVRDAARHWGSNIVENLRTATTRRSCEWEWNLQELRGPDLIGFMLEEIQWSRGLARGLSLRTRLALAEGDFERALSEMRMNYRLGVDVAKEPLLVCDLVGIAICGITHRNAIELIAQPDSPNLYWAIAELPSPMVSVRESMAMEMSLALRTFPFLLDAEKISRSPEEWSRVMAEAFVNASDMGLSGLPNSDNRMKMARLGVAGMSLVAYPPAKQRLIDYGMEPAKVEAMPVGQVIAIDAGREYRRIADAIEKWNYVPYRNKPNNVEWEVIKSGPGSLSAGLGNTVAGLLLPAARAARTAEQRLIWQTGGIQTVEAIRMHAAQTGKLPTKLAEIRAVPLPINPLTNRPYQYRLRGKTGTLELPFADGFPGIAYRFEITLSE